jgi:hypothetical protein
VDGARRRFDPAADLAEFRLMTLHLIKLCVGAESIDDLAEWIERKLADKRAAGLPVEQWHTTRMVPRRMAELLDGGSLYWVIKGNVQVRQRLLDVRPFTDDEGIGRCRLVLEPEMVPTAWQPKRAFQGWRYFDPKDVPRDLDDAGGEGLPPELAAELAGLGLR